MSPHLHIRQMRHDELDTLVDWAAREGWNPGLHDADIFWDADPDGFIAAEIAGELIGGGSIVSYGSRFGFMGFFIVKPEFRGQGLGNRLWHYRRDTLASRLAPSAAIGMDGVFDMQAYYAKGGFQFVNRDLRFQGTGEATQPATHLRPLAALPFDQVLAYDSAHFPAPRPAFLRAWIAQADSRALGAVRDDGRLCGYGVARACREGCKIGPLFAEDPGTAEDLFRGLGDHARGQPLFLDVPENNQEAMALARRHGMSEVFGCARMYRGPVPELPHGEIYGVTSFELG